MKLGLFFLSAAIIGVVVSSKKDDDDFGSRIVGGTDVVNKGQYPFMVSWYLTDDNTEIYPNCGGSLVAPNFVLTAAHCDRDGINGKIRVGSIYSLDSAEKQENNGYSPSDNKARVIRKIKHPKYGSTNGGRLMYDFMLLELDRSIDVMRYPLIEVNFDSQLPQHSYLKVIGFGSTDFGGNNKKTTRLKEVSVPMVSIDQCRAQYGTDINPIIHLCAGEKGKDSCQGDSGGPLFSTTGHNKYTLMGVTSFGIGCGEANFSGVYARVSGAKSWLKNKVCASASNQSRVKFCQTAAAPTFDADADWVCTNSPVEWKDQHGDNCDYYALGTNCDKYGHKYPGTEGKTANDACCECDGGIDIIEEYDDDDAAPLEVKSNDDDASVEDDDYDEADVPMAKWSRIGTETFEKEDEHLFKGQSKWSRTMAIGGSTSAELKKAKKILAMNSSMDVVNYSKIQITFFYNYSSESNDPTTGVDILALEVGYDDIPWTIAKEWELRANNDELLWTKGGMMLQTAGSKTMRFRFFFKANNIEDRIYIDDVSFKGLTTSTTE